MRHVETGEVAMKAKVGDRIVLAPRNVDGQTRDGEVVEVRGDGGEPPYLVRWSDGHEGLFFPGAGAVLHVGHADHATAAAAAAPAPSAPTAPSPQGAATASTPSAAHIRDWTVRISVFEGDDTTAAHAVLLSDAPEHLTARGHSQRNPKDRSVPEIGDEVAVARALRHLADQLLATAELDIESVTGQEAHVSAT